MSMLREQRKGTMTLTTRSQLLAVCVCLLAVALVYAPGFGGFWIGDDLTNLHHFHRWAEDGRLWSDTLARFFQGISAQGSAYRPLSILSLSANYAIAGSHTKTLLELAKQGRVELQQETSFAPLMVKARQGAGA